MISLSPSADHPCRIAIIGCGEVGRCYAVALAKIPHCRIELCDVRPPLAARKVAQQIGVDLHEEPGVWLARQDIVISCVVGGAALAVAEAATACMRTGSIFADYTTAASDDKKAAAAIASRGGIHYVDTVILGAISTGGVRTPLLCVGEGSESVRDLMVMAGASVRILENGAVGDAATLKLLRTIFTKGVEALAVECLVAAEQRGLRQQLYEVLADFDRTPLRTRLDTLVQTHVVHAQRRLHEVSEAEMQVLRSGLPAHVLSGVKALFADTCEAKSRTPADGWAPKAEEAIAWLLQTRQKRADAEPVAHLT